MTTISTTSWRQKLMSALLILLLVAGAARLAWELLSPIVAPLVVLLALGGIWWFIFGRRR